MAESISRLHTSSYIHVSDYIPPATYMFPDYIPLALILFFMFPSSTDEVAQLIENLNDKKTERSNDVETRFIKYSKSIISPIISNLFNLCVNKGVFLNCLKIAEIIPIYKKGDINKATNYGPIVLLSQFNKLMEKRIFSRLYLYLEKNNYLMTINLDFDLILPLLSL